MAYPPPPGISTPNPASSSASHPSLPARPPPSKVTSGFKPAFTPAFKTQLQSTPTYPSNTSNYGPHAPATQHGSSYQQFPATTSTPTINSASYQRQAQPYSYPQANYPASSYEPSATTTSYGAPPQIRNPFPIGNDYDNDMALQIAQWQSAYVTKDANSKDGAAVDGMSSTAVAPAILPPDAGKISQPPTAGAEQEKKKTVIRQGGGKKWTDESLLEWDPAHLRLFVGNLAGEVTDDSLLKAFAPWKSVQKARVIRDKRTSKSKGYGFVSFSDPDDFFQAAKEMNGKYIQSHPVVVKKATTEIRSSTVKTKDKHKKQHGRGDRNGSKQPGAFEPSLGPVKTGVQKAGQKTKNGLRILG